MNLSFDVQAMIFVVSGRLKTSFYVINEIKLRFDEIQFGFAPANLTTFKEI